MRRVAVLVAVALLAACGSDGESGSSDDGGDPPKDTTTSEPEEERDLEADQDLADGAVLTIDDVPEGYEAEPEDDDEDDAELEQLFADCLEIDVAELNGSDDEPQASTTFANEALEEVSSDVVVYETEDAVREDLARWKDPATQTCFAEAVNELAARDETVEYGEVSIEEIDVASLGKDAVGFGITMPFISEGVERALYLDAVFVTQGRSGISVSFQAFDTPFDAELASELITTVVDRVPADA